MASAFQPGAFQFGAFQWGAEAVPGFQAGAFQFGAFQCRRRAASVSSSGGWHGLSYPRQERAKYVHERRIASGILPKPVQRAIRATVKRVIRTSEPQKAVLVEELEKRDVAYQPDYLDAVRKVYALTMDIERVKTERRRKRHRSEEEMLLMLI